MRSWCVVVLGVVSGLVGCGQGVEVRAASLAECGDGGVVIDEFVVCSGQGPMGAPGEPGPPGPLGPPGPMGRSGMVEALESSIGSIDGVVLCTRLEPEVLFSYRANVYRFSSGYVFGNLTFATPLTSASSALFYPPGAAIESFFADGAESGGITRLPGSFTQTVDLVGRRWQMRQDDVLYFDVPIDDAGFCAVTL